MTPERWHRVEELLAGAGERPAAERPEWLRRAAGDPEVEREVAALLAAEAAGRLPESVHGAGGWLARLLPASGEAPPPVPPLPLPCLPQPGDRLGPWRLGRELGRGGAGVVWEAERDDGLYHARTAVKVLHTAADPDLLARFRAERRILSTLEHRNVARLLDAGTTPAGLPSFALELVEGEPIDRWCDRHDPPVERRVALMLEVCAAVEHAHRRAVVHRDLKPGNVLVGPGGVPKLLDFGVARLLDGGGDAELTVPWLRRLTPGWASPEQLRGEPAGTAADIYALGVLLYRLLAGCLPERGPRFDRPPPPPSSARTAIDRDLDAIVLTALAPEPGDRYPSVERLADDLRRWLDGRPVAARTPTLRYRAGKLLRRHRRAFAAAAGALLLIAALGTALVAQSLRAADRDAAARAERQKAEQLAGFLADAFAGADPRTSQGAEVSAREILDRGAGNIAEALAGQPGPRAELMQRLGGIYLQLGVYDRAEELLTGALAALEELPDPAPERLASIWSDLGELRLVAGEIEGAEAAFRRALAIERERWGEDAPELGPALANLAVTLQERGEIDAADALFRDALARLERRDEAGSHEPDDDLALPAALSGHATLRIDLGDLDGAEELLERSLAAYRERVGELHPGVIGVLHNLAALHQLEGRPERAEAALRRVAEAERRVLGADHPVALNTLSNLATVVLELDRAAEAEALFRRVLDRRRELLGERHPDTLVALHNLAATLHRRGDPRAAEPLYRQALASREEVLGAGHPTTTLTRLLLGELLTQTGRAAEAEPLLRQGLGAFRERLPPGDWRTAVAESMLGACLAERGRAGEAEPLLRASLRTLEAALGDEARHTREARTRLDRARSRT